MQGIIFDFNGTMVFDGHLQEKAWISMIKKYNDQATEDEIVDYIHGRTNDVILNHFIDDISDEEIEKLAEEKELEYQRLVREENLTYVKGTEVLLDELVEKDIPFTIATASPKINIDFYFDYFKLDQWFDLGAIVYDDGTFPRKPEPDIYEIAAESLGLSPEDCIVIEDAVAGIQSANAANIKKVFVMVDSREQRAYYEKLDLEIEAIINNFHHFFENYIK